MSMKRLLTVLTILLTTFLTAQTPPPPPSPVPASDKKAEPKKPEKAEQEPRPESQEQQKRESQKKDAPPPGQATPPSPSPIGAEGAAEKKEAKKWDVDNPPGPRHDVNLDVTEGTWLSVDVSPDGKEISFDLLGDLYTIPMAGGEAKALTTGIAWDMQPRYSPNGKWIAFTSDRAGGDNLWIMERDGSKPQQV